MPFDFARYSYRTATITSPTLEAAPVAYRVWLPQRTRWLKGWIQTWLVHMRHPVRFAKEVGPASFIVSQILLAGTVASALLHPLLIVTAIAVIVELAVSKTINPWHSTLLLVDVANIVCGYASFLLLGWQTMSPEERRDFWKVVVFTPVYWLMQSRAGWRALRQIFHRPHHWEKTPHGKRPGSPLPGESGSA